MVRTLGRLLLLLVCLQALPSQAQRLSDALSQQQQINIEFDWKHRYAGDELDVKEFNAVIAHARNVDTRLDTSDFVDTRARIFIELPVQVHGLNNPQRLSVSWTTNGLFQNGDVTPQLIKHHKDVAAGGVAMTTVAYCSVSYDGRAFGHELWMRKEIIPDLSIMESK